MEFLVLICVGGGISGLFFLIAFWDQYTTKTPLITYTTFCGGIIMIYLLKRLINYLTSRSS